MGEAENRRRRQCGLYLAVALLCSCWFITARGDFAADQKECAPSLTGLMTCLDYVEGRSDAPPQDCCSGLLQVIVDSRRCLCVLIKDRNEPQLPFKINATRAISLPYICLSSTNITECIDLLKMDPTSPEAQIFKQNVSLSNSTSNVIKPPKSGGGVSGDSASGGTENKRKWGGGLGVVSVLVFLSWCSYYGG